MRSISSSTGLRPSLVAKPCYSVVKNMGPGGVRKSLRKMVACQQIGVSCSSSGIWPEPILLLFHVFCRPHFSCLKLRKRRRETLEEDEEMDEGEFQKLKDKSDKDLMPEDMALPEDDTGTMGGW